MVSGRLITDRAVPGPQQSVATLAVEPRFGCDGIRRCPADPPARMRSSIFVVIEASGADRGDDGKVVAGGAAESGLATLQGWRGVIVTVGS